MALFSVIKWPCFRLTKTWGPRGKGKRHLQTEGDQEIVLNRSYGVCPTCKVGFFSSG